MRKVLENAVRWDLLEAEKTKQEYEDMMRIRESQLRTSLEEGRCAISNVEFLGFILSDYGYILSTLLYIMV